MGEDQSGMIPGLEELMWFKRGKSRRNHRKEDLLPPNANADDDDDDDDEAKQGKREGACNLK